MCENLYSRNWSNVRFGPELKRGGDGCCFSKAENFWNKNEHRMSFHIPGGGVAMSSSGDQAIVSLTKLEGICLRSKVN